MDPRLGKYASLLKDGAPVVLSKEIVILQYELESFAKKVNIKSNQEPLKEIISKLLGRTVSVYAVPRQEVVKLFETEIGTLNFVPPLNTVKFHSINSVPTWRQLSAFLVLL